jgi:Mor family transcriptional regulator
MLSDIDIHKTIHMLGYDLVAAFLKTFEGRIITIPESVEDFYRLYPEAESMRRELSKNNFIDDDLKMVALCDVYFQKLLAFYGSRPIKIPQIQRKKVTERDLKVVQAKEEGVSIEEITKLFELTDKRVYQILALKKQHARRPQKVTEKRNYRIVKDYKNGRSIDDMIGVYGLSERRMNDILLDAGCIIIKKPRKRRNVKHSLI